MKANIFLYNDVSMFLIPFNHFQCINLYFDTLKTIIIEITKIK